MATRAEIEALLDEFAEDSERVQETIHWSVEDHYRAKRDREATRARLLALLAPEPEPSDDDGLTPGDLRHTAVVMRASADIYAASDDKLAARAERRIAKRLDALAAAQAARQTGGDIQKQ